MPSTSWTLLQLLHLFLLFPDTTYGAITPTDAPTPCGQPLCQLEVACSSTQGSPGLSACRLAPLVAACSRAQTACSTVRGLGCARPVTMVGCSTAHTMASLPRLLLCSRLEK
ncbi:unnamed protein product [Urochloa humidicola]